MGFSTQIFIFYFLPISLAVFSIVSLLCKVKGRIGRFFINTKTREIVMIIFSCLFYWWTGIEITIILACVIIVYLVGLLIRIFNDENCLLKGYCGKNNNCLISKIITFFAIVTLLFCLFYFKYFNFSVSLINKVFKIEFSQPTIVAPLGISFIVFSAISYLVDIYRKKSNTGTILDCALFLLFFPKIISGPIVLWQNFEKQIGKFEFNTQNVYDGITKIIIGLLKKVVLADTFGKCISDIGSNSIDWVTSVGILVLYTLQIYFDFAGYSSIAIGVARLFGFKFDENFNFPYKSKSITEFWRRWHISLGAWFKEYVYIPLGGNRKGLKRTLLNLTIVFVLTGVWHGAGLNYLLWGVTNGLFMLIERLIKDKPFYKKIPNVIKWIVTMLIVTFCWQLFRCNTLTQFNEFLSIVFGKPSNGNVYYNYKHYFDAQIITLVIFSVLGCVGLGNEKVVNLYNKFAKTKTGLIIKSVALLIILVIDVLFIVNSSYSPFIYFQY